MFHAFTRPSLNTTGGASRLKQWFSNCGTRPEWIVTPFMSPFCVVNSEPVSVQSRFSPFEVIVLVIGLSAIVVYFCVFFHQINVSNADYFNYRKHYCVHEHYRTINITELLIYSISFPTKAHHDHLYCAGVTLRLGTIFHFVFGTTTETILNLKYCDLS